MPLIVCTECKNRISDRTEACPHCSLLAKYFNVSALHLHQFTDIILDEDI